MRDRIGDNINLLLIGVLLSIGIAGWMSDSARNDLANDKNDFALTKSNDARREAALRCIAERLTIATQPKKKEHLKPRLTPDCETAFATPVSK